MKRSKKRTIMTMLLTKQKSSPSHLWDHEKSISDNKSYNGDDTILYKVKYKGNIIGDDCKMANALSEHSTLKKMALIEENCFEEKQKRN